MRHLQAFARFWWDFVVGDDWRVAAGVLVALGITALLRETDAGWTVLPVGVIVLLAASLRRAQVKAHESA